MNLIGRLAVAALFMGALANAQGVVQARSENGYPYGWRVIVQTTAGPADTPSRVTLLFPDTTGPYSYTMQPNTTWIMIVGPGTLPSAVTTNADQTQFPVTYVGTGYTNPTGATPQITAPKKSLLRRFFSKI